MDILPVIGPKLTKFPVFSLLSREPATENSSNVTTHTATTHSKLLSV